MDLKKYGEIRIINKTLQNDVLVCFSKSLFSVKVVVTASARHTKGFEINKKKF